MNKIIETKAEHSAAIARLSALMNVDPVLGTMHANELELLAHLIEDYEKKHHDLGLPDPLTAVSFRMEQLGLTRKDMVPYFGSSRWVSEVLDGQRPLALDMIRNLHRGLDIPAEPLLGGAEHGDMPVIPPPSGRSHQ